MRALLPAVMLMALPVAAWAQESTAAPTKDKEAVTFQEIERGINITVGGGPYFLAQAPNGGPFSSGQTARVEAGYDFGERVSGEVFIMGTTNRADSAYRGKSTFQNPASGDFSALIPGASARFNIIGFVDSQDVKRLWLYAKGGVGYVIFQPSALLPYSDVFLNGAFGVDYFTHLRHFSVGLEVDVSFLVSSGSLGFSLLPNLRYAF